MYWACNAAGSKCTILHDLQRQVERMRCISRIAEIPGVTEQIERAMEMVRFQLTYHDENEWDIIVNLSGHIGDQDDRGNDRKNFLMVAVHNRLRLPPTKTTLHVEDFNPPENT